MGTMKKIIESLAYIGSASMIAAPWVGNMMVPAIITGMVLLTPQAVDRKAYNLVLLNLVGIVGYAWRLIG